MKKILYSLALFTLAGCAANKPDNGISVVRELNSNEVNPTETSIALSDYLRRIPGVQIMGRDQDIRVLVRGNSSMGTETEPLFIIDGLNIGFGYQKAAPLVDVNDIANVRVLKSGVDTASYGMQGSNGVIIITTKR